MVAGQYLDPEYKKKWAKHAYKQNIKSYLLRNARARARVKKLEFDLSKDDIVIPVLCPVLGIPIEVAAPTKEGKRDRNNAPSLDRKDNSKGYTKDNVWVISFRANRIKTDATYEELTKVAAYCRDTWR